MNTMRNYSWTSSAAVQIGTLWEHLHALMLFITKGNNFCDFLLASLKDKALAERGSSLKGKNLLLKEQILPFQA